MSEFNPIEALCVSKQDKNDLNNHKSFVLWFTGLSGSGKSTLAKNLEKSLYERSIRTVVLDGDNIRNHLCSDLGFTIEDRAENIRRVSEVSKLFLDCGIVTLAAFISPIAKERNAARAVIGESNFIEVYCNCPIEICIRRDKKNLYNEVSKGKIKNFTGIDSLYEAPENPELTINTHDETIEHSIKNIIDYLVNHKYITQI